jgi:hypothetical protein
LKKILLAAATLALLVPVAAAQAEPVQEFNFQLKDIKRDGRFTVVFTSRTYDTTGGQPPLLTSNFIRLPKGAVLQKPFRGKRYNCDSDKLLATLQAAPEPGPFFKRLENLKSTISKIRKRTSKKDLANVKTCARSEIGRGSVVVDARPLFNDPIPAKIYLYLSKAKVQNGVASFGILGVPDETSAVVRGNPTIANTRVVVYAHFVDEPTSDGLYGYKIVIPAGTIGGLRISVAEVRVENKGLTAVKKKRTCTKRRGGKCAKRKTKRKLVFWFNRPPCPPSGKLSFQANYGYETGATAVRTIELACPRFR